MSKWICKLMIFNCVIFSCLAEVTEAKQSINKLPPCLVYTDGDHTNAEKIGEIPPPNIPIGSGQIQWIVLDTMIQLYAFNPEGKQDVTIYPEPLVKYLAELQVRIKKQEGALEALDVRLLNTEIDSREWQSERTKMLRNISTLKDVYKELYAILQQSIPVK